MPIINLLPHAVLLAVIISAVRLQLKEHLEESAIKAEILIAHKKQRKAIEDIKSEIEFYTKVYESCDSISEAEDKGYFAARISVMYNQLSILEKGAKGND